MAIVSAKGGVTDKLIQVVKASLDNMEQAEELLSVVAAEQIEVVREISNPEAAALVEAAINADAADILNVVRANGLMKLIPPSTMELVTGYGEVWSAMTMHAYLVTKGVPTAWLDARQVLLVEQSGGAGLGDKGSSNVVGVDPLWRETSERVRGWWADPVREHLLQTDCSDKAPIVVVTGFVASTVGGTPTTLKRSGSDYSATIFARLMGASKITMWKNVNGVYTADPRRVPEAFPIESLKYDEAIELAYFGAQVLHPSAMMPCIENRIPIYVRNVFNPSHPGTVIQGRACTLEASQQAWLEEASAAKKQVRKAACPVKLGDGESPIRGITSVDNVALVNIEGTGTSSVPDMASRLFGTLERAGVQVVMLTQASADSSICLAVGEPDAETALTVLEVAFEKELAKGLVAGITIEHGHAVVAIVGEGMAFRPGTGATFTKAMANAGINIRSIAQGSSERQISIIVEQEDCTKALRAAHAALALSNMQLSVAVIGCSGMVGAELLKQMLESKRIIGDSSAKRKVLDDLRLDYKVTALVRSSGMRLSYDGIDVTSNGEAQGEIISNDLEVLAKFLSDDYNGNRVVIDCSASQEVASFYPRLLSLGINVITANKKAGAGPMELYDDCVRQTGASAQWYYETTGPGSGLPVLSTLKDMMQSGDRVSKVQGVFSGTISYITNALADGVPLSEALQQAAALGLCEPDPRDDLAGLDVRRKVVVLARELGLRLELADVPCDSLIPEGLIDWAPDNSEGTISVAAQLAEALRPYDAEVSERFAVARAEGLELVHLGTVDVSSGEASVHLTQLPKDDPLARCVANENVVAITSQRYSPRPMLLQGPGAGAEITASGLFADLLHLSRTLVEWTIPKIE
uniref:ACT domain-containing protein n=1 Tax=Coccolithus braarudii TaxID=221442 RepID=A0A7S0L1V1_9EUKA